MPLAQTSRSGPPSSAAAPSPRQSSNASVSSLSDCACGMSAVLSLVDVVVTVVVVVVAVVSCGGRW